MTVRELSPFVLFRLDYCYSLYVYQLCLLTRLYDFGLVHFCPQATRHSQWINIHCCSVRERLQMIFRIVSYSVPTSYSYWYLVSVAYLPRGQIGHGPLGQKKFFFTVKKLENLVWPPLCVSTSGQRTFGLPPFLKFYCLVSLQWVTTV